MSGASVRKRYASFPLNKSSVPTVQLEISFQKVHREQCHHFLKLVKTTSLFLMAQQLAVGKYHPFKERPPSSQCRVHRIQKQQRNLLTQVWASVSDLALEQTDSAVQTEMEWEAEVTATAPCGTPVPHSGPVAHAGWAEHDFYEKPPTTQQSPALQPRRDWN